MAGTGEADDDALLVLTAVLLTPAQFPSVLGDDYPEACAALGLAPLADGYGLVLGQDGEGARWTVAVDDVSLVAVAIATWDCGMEYDLSPDERSVVAALPGWPLALAVAAPGVPAPHDPEPDPEDGRPALTPPDTESWGPAQRRLGADEIALQWAAWRAQVDDADFVTLATTETSGPRSGSGAAATTEGSTTAESPTVGEASMAAEASTATEGTATAEGSLAAGGSDRPGAERPEGADGDPKDTADSESVGGGDDGSGVAGPKDGTAREGGADAPEGSAGAGMPAGVRRALDEARGYIDSPPPLGRVRSAFATEDARTLRVDGPGWSMVARTDDIAFVLLDEEPGEILPVGRGTELPGLVEALDKMAVRPA